MMDNPDQHHDVDGPRNYRNDRQNSQVGVRLINCTFQRLVSFYTHGFFLHRFPPLPSQSPAAYLVHASCGKKIDLGSKCAMETRLGGATGG